jgi:hypothetical protein
MDDVRVTLLSGEARFIEYDAPTDHVPYFKVWDTGAALLSSIHKDLKIGD